MSKVIFFSHYSSATFKFQTDEGMSALIRLTAITKHIIEHMPTNDIY